MITTPIDWAAEIMRANGTGLNAQLLDVPRAADELPPDPVRIFDENTDDAVVRGAITQQMLLDFDKDPSPIFLIRLHRLENGIRVQLLPEFLQDDPTIIPVELVYAARRVTDTGVTLAELKRAARQTMRTAFRVVAQQFQSSMTAIERDGITMTMSRAGALLMSEFPESTGDLVTDVGIIPLHVFDRWTLGL